MSATTEHSIDRAGRAVAGTPPRRKAQEPTSVLDRMGKGNLLYVVPGLLIYAIFVFFPIIAAVVISLTE